jgi:ABC-type amino acid transport substrate-binding protein
MLLRRLIALCLLPWASLGRAAPQASPIVEPVRLLTSSAASPHGDEVANAAIELMMRHAHLSYTLRREPPERAVASFRAGLYDADVLRFAQYDRVVPGAIRVDPHLLSTTFVAFTRSPALSPRDWAALDGLRVAHVRGVKVLEQRLAGRPGVEVTSAPSACLGMVSAGRVDVCVLHADVAYAAQQLKGPPLHRSVLARVNLHVWVAPGRQDLAQRLAQALRACVASGELARVAGPDRQP